MKMSARQLMIEMAVALLLATFAMSLDDVHATHNEQLGTAPMTCEQRLPALDESDTQTENGVSKGSSISDETANCLSAGKAGNNKKQNSNWLRLLP
jgi:hypothetical protein